MRRAIEWPKLAGWAWLAAGALAALLLLWRTVLPAMSARAYAFSAYYTAARLTLQGQAGAQLCGEWFFAQQRALGFGDRADFFCPNPPTTALLLLPVAWLPPYLARPAWVTLDVLMGLAVVAIAWRVVVTWPESGRATSKGRRTTRDDDGPSQRHETRDQRRTISPISYLLSPISYLLSPVSRLDGAQWSVAHFLALAAIVTALFKPLHADWQTNQVYTLIALLYALWLYGYLTARDWLCGAALAGLALAKLSGWPLWLLMLFALRWRALAWAVGLGIAGLLLSLPLFGLDFWRLYLLEQLGAIPSEPSSAVPANQTLISLLRQCLVYDPRWSPAPLLDAPRLAGALWWALALALLGATLRAARYRAPIVAALAILCLVVPLQPAGEEYHYTPLLLVLLILLSRSSDEGRGSPGSAARAAALGLTLLLFALPAYFVDTAAFAGWPRALAAYPRMYGALLLWGVLIVGDKITQRLPPANPPADLVQ
jgi:hypothetical protein